MSRTQKINELLERAEQSMVKECLEYFSADLSCEVNASKIRKRRASIFWKRAKRTIAGVVLGDWLRRIWNELPLEARTVLVSIILVILSGYGVNYLYLRAPYLTQISQPGLRRSPTPTGTIKTLPPPGIELFQNTPSDDAHSPDSSHRLQP